MLTAEQLDWLKSKLNLDSLADVFKAAKVIFPNSDIVPTISMAGRTGVGKSSFANALVGWRVSSVGLIPATQHPTPNELEGDGVSLRVLDMPGMSRRRYILARGRDTGFSSLITQSMAWVFQEKI